MRCSAATEPALSVAPSITIASSSTRPAKFKCAPMPASNTGIVFQHHNRSLDRVQRSSPFESTRQPASSAASATRAAGVRRIGRNGPGAAVNDQCRFHIWEGALEEKVQVSSFTEKILRQQVQKQDRLPRQNQAEREHNCQRAARRLSTGSKHRSAVTLGPGPGAGCAARARRETPPYMPPSNSRCPRGVATAVANPPASRTSPRCPSSPDC